jgi:magnesium chelatase subunit I
MIQFPFTAIVGMEQAKRSLIYHAIDPRIGGTLFLGHRGCAKSTLVRGFADILQSGSNGNAPFVEVPLGTTEDRLLGSVNAETLVEHSKWQGRAGLIEEANGGVLYIDEINLLPDHLADFILDSAASGRYRMERDGLTRIVENRYILVGTMNPEEGDLRPQLSDRFAHGVQIQDAFTPEARMEIVQRRIQFDDDPEKFAAAFASTTAELKSRVALAQTRLKDVRISHGHRMAVAARGEMLRLEGIRAELAVVRTARCAAAWDQRSEVEQHDIEEAWELCLGHRQPEPPDSHTPASLPFDARSDKYAASRLTSPAPLESRPDLMRLRAPKTTFNKKLREWLHQPRYRHRAAFDRSGSGGFTTEPRSAIAWLETLVFSARTKWLHGTKTFHLRHRLPSAKKNLWCFLDASRSTGASRFLDTARDIIAGLARSAKSARFHLLVLKRGEIRWLARSSTFRRFEAALFRLNEAGGKSLIVESLKILHRAKLKKGNPSRDQLVIVSDGLASPTQGEKPSQTLRRLRHALHQHARTQSPIAWIHPPARRGLARWLPAVCGDLKVQRLESGGDAL